MSSNIRSDTNDQDLDIVREKLEDEQYEHEIIHKAKDKNFFDSHNAGGLFGENKPRILNDLMNIYTQGHDASQLFEESGDTITLIVLRIIGCLSANSGAQPNTAQIDYALIVFDAIARKYPEYLSYFRNVAMQAYEEALTIPQVQAFNAKFQKERELHAAMNAARASEKIISGETASSLTYQPKPLEDLGRYGGLHDASVFEHLIFITKNSQNKFTGFQTRKALRILSHLISEDIPESHIVHRHVFRLLVKTIDNSVGLTQLCALNGLKVALQNKALHDAFYLEDGFKCLSAILKKDTKAMQPLYLAGYSVWLLSYNSDNDVYFHNYHMVHKCSEIIKVIAREKVVRMCLNILVNLLSRSNFCEEMIGADLPRTLNSLTSRKFKDADIDQSISQIQTVVLKRINELSNFDMYAAELASGTLRKSPVHNEKFWKENHSKFDENNFQLISQLIAQLDNKSEVAVEMACYDLGEFARFHPDGKRVLARLGGKTKLMEHVQNSNIEISKAALLAVQKLLIHKWDQMKKM